MRRALGTIAIAVCGLLLPAGAQAVTYAPVDQASPALSVPQSTLDASLKCHGNLAAGPTPVLLVHGTGSSPDENFSWNYEPALNALNTAWCTVAESGRGMDDVQVSGELVVNAIRSMYAQAGRRISIIGHSQGGMLPRWALRFWPDTRNMVDDQIGLAPSNHGTTGAKATCIPDCAPAVWQQSDGSEFIKALNSFKETFAGISYTEIYSHNDEIVTPNSDDNGSSSLHTGDGQIRNVAIQDVCPGDVSEHLAIGTQSNTAYALAIDALTHPGPADPSRIDTMTVCANPLMPGINPATYAADVASSGAGLLSTIATYPHVPAEPALRCYVIAGGCTATTQSNPNANKTNSKCKKKRKAKHKKHAAASKKHKKKRGCKKKKHKKHKMRHHG